MFPVMARRPRIEIEGGLYHVITRGNNRQTIFETRDDYRKIVSLIAQQKTKLSFYLYAYCLMPNHVHLLLERREDPISRLMHRVLTGYSQYFNRRHRRTGHLLQGRYKAYLCESDQYLGELVRYIHLNPVRAGLVRRPEDYPYSSHRIYLGLEESGLVDAEPVLRYFGANKREARATYRQFVRAGMRLGHLEEVYRAEMGQVLGSQEFLEETKRRVGQIPRGARPQYSGRPEAIVTVRELVKAVEIACDLSSDDFCSSRKGRHVVQVKEAMILVGSERGLSQRLLAEISRLEASVVSRRLQAAKIKMRDSREFKGLVRRIERQLDRSQRNKAS